MIFVSVATDVFLQQVRAARKTVVAIVGAAKVFHK